MEIKKKRAPRRTQTEIEENIMEVLENLVIEKGFSNILLTDLINSSGIEASVFYRRYGTVSNALNILSKRYDFWINDAIDIKQLNILGPKEFYKTVLKSLYRELKANPTMQKLLIWELNEDNEETRRTSNMREAMNMGLISYYELLFKNTSVDIKLVTAILISSIYYLVLHKDRSPFCTIDINTDAADNTMCNGIDYIVELIFAELDNAKKFRGIIIRMKVKGISDDDICELLNISSNDLKRYLN